MNPFSQPGVKRLFGLSGWFLLTLFTITSCQDAALDNQTTPSDANLAPTAPNQLPGMLSSADDGMLVFADFDAFNAALEAVAPTTTSPLSVNELRAIEARFGVSSMQSKYLSLVDDFDTESELPANWMDKNRSVILPFDDGISPTIGDVAFRSLINEDGRVKVGGDVYVYTEDYLLIAKERALSFDVDQAIITGEEDNEAGIYIFSDWQQSTADTDQKTCSGGSTRGCTAPQTSNHRVRGNWGFTSNFSVTENEVCFPPPPFDPQSCQTVSLTFVISPRYFANAKVEDRGWFGRWTRDNTILSFTCGVRATGLSGSGTGWTSNSRVHEINVSWSAGPTTVSTVPAGTGQVPEGRFRTLDYVTGGVDDELISGLFCFGCCPWDCADLDESDIP